ncbi:hypothetical protein LUX57_45970 [Actinomadura madurae]|uniref:hypothetical protein n=1 Tax=Actinomadura madurae TaxID=1993 RepID=UPI0020D25261|nr:hypothetical protein [Actinomadura madurae]MCP9971558.1 hypothetical protein [Actinomadura madurae]
MLGKHTGHRRPGRSGIIDSGPEATSGGEAPEPSGAERLRRPMPEAVRQGVVEVAADLIGTLPAEEVPAPLRRFARFERRKRAKLAGQHIAAMLEKDAGFRRRVAGPLREAQADLAEAVEDGDVPPPPTRCGSRCWATSCVPRAGPSSWRPRARSWSGPPPRRRRRPPSAASPR